MKLSTDASLPGFEFWTPQFGKSIPLIKKGFARDHEIKQEFR